MGWLRAGGCRGQRREGDAVLPDRPGRRLPHGHGFRFVAGSFLELGPATVWTRMRHPLVAGEVPSPLCRVLVAADSGNGVSATLDFRHWRFINPDLTVYLLRPPAGEWVALEAATTARPASACRHHPPR